MTLGNKISKKKSNSKINKKYLMITGILSTLILITFLVSLNMGSLSISPLVLIKTFIGQESKAHHIAIF